MRKVLAVSVAVLVCALATTVSAQDEGKGLTAKGFKVGLNLANIAGSDVDVFKDAISDFTGLSASNKQLMGFAFGGFLTYNFSPTVALQPEFLYTMKGFTLSVEGLDVDFKMDYFEIPVLVKFMFGTGSAKPCLFAGPAMGILVSAKMEAIGLSVDAKELWKSTDLGLVFGGGVDFPVGKGTMTVDGRYTMGMSKTPDSGDIDIDLKNSNISFMVGYGF